LPREKVDIEVEEDVKSHHVSKFGFYKSNSDEAIHKDVPKA